MAVPPPRRPQGEQRGRPGQRGPRPGARSPTSSRPGRAVAEDDEWRQVTATGDYDADDTVIVRYRTRDGASGIDVVVPLVTADGTALLVDRGWMAADNEGAGPDDVPAPPSGEVTVDGWVRADADRRQHRRRPTTPRGRSPASEIGAAIGQEVYGGFVELDAEDGRAGRGRSSRSSCPSSTTARTSSTGCSGGSSGCSRSSASATSPGTSGARSAATSSRRASEALAERKQQAGRQERPEAGRARRRTSRRTPTERAARDGSERAQHAAVDRQHRRRRRTTRPATAGTPRPGRTPPARRSGAAGSSATAAARAASGVAGGGVELATRSVPTRPGSSPLTRMPAGPSSSASVLATIARPGRSPLEIARSASGARTLEDSTKASEPPCGERGRPRGRAGPRRGRPTRRPSVHCSSVIAGDRALRRAADADQRAVEPAPALAGGARSGGRASPGRRCRPRRSRHRVAERRDGRRRATPRCGRRATTRAPSATRHVGGRAAEPAGAAGDDVDTVGELEIHARPLAERRHGTSSTNWVR